MHFDHIKAIKVEKGIGQWPCASMQTQFEKYQIGRIKITQSIEVLLPPFKGKIMCIAFY